MIRITIDDPATLDLLKHVYANKLNAASRGARYAMNAKKKAFKEAVRLTAKVEGEPPQGEPIAAIYSCTLTRCDWDAPIKSLQDSIENWIACKNDRVIRYAFCFLARPGAGSKNKPPRKRQIIVDLFNAAEEHDALIARINALLHWGSKCWHK